MAAFDLVVGIDFGMTSTGVAYMKSNNRTISHMAWTAPDEAILCKCPTTLKYAFNEKLNGFALESCGAECRYGPKPDQQVRYVEWFKLFLEPSYLETAIEKRIPWAPALHSEVFQWFVDYLTFLRHEIQAEIVSSRALPSDKSWESSKIDFRFSYPQIWSIEATNRFHDAIRVAGFEKEEHHKTIVGLTEAQASAMHVIRQNPCVLNENTILVMDVGGGTTDVVKFQVHIQLDSTLRCHNLEPMQRMIGFSAVEREWEDHVHRALLALPNFQSKEKQSPGWVRQVAIGIRRSDWFISHAENTDAHTTNITLSHIDEISGLLADPGLENVVTIEQEDLSRCLKVLSHPLVEMLRRIELPPDYFAFVGGVANTKIHGFVTDWVRSHWSTTRILAVKHPSLAPSAGLVDGSFTVWTRSIGVIRKQTITWLIKKGDNISHVSFQDSFPIFTNKHYVLIVTTDQEPSKLPDGLRGSENLELYTICFRLHKKRLISFTFNMSISAANVNSDLHFDLGPHSSSLKIESVSRSKV